MKSPRAMSPLSLTAPLGFFLIALVALVAGCGQREAEEAAGERMQPAQRAAEQSAPQAQLEWTPERVDRVLLQTNPGYEGEAYYQIRDGRVFALQLSGTTITNMPFLKDMGVQVLDLRGLPLTDLKQIEGLDLAELYVEDTDIRDIRPLRGMNLRQLYLSNTYVTDLTPLEGMPLEQLNLLGTDVTDLTPLEGMPLVFLWLNQTPVSNITALSNCPNLMSLTLHRTRVSDLNPLSGTGLKRLHIGETPVTDLTPLRGLDLTRLVFTPANIRKGLEVARNLASLQEVGTTFENLMPPGVFWHLYDTGEFEQ